MQVSITYIAKEDFFSIFYIAFQATIMLKNI